MAEVTSLPIRTTVDDIKALTGYLATKPIGATQSEARAVIDSGVLDGRKLNAMKFWGLIEEGGDRLRLTDRGRRGAKERHAALSGTLLETVRATPPYVAIVERAAHKSEFVITAVEVASHWHDHFTAVVSPNERILNDQAVCFFQLAQGADLGELILGRKGAPTRFEFDQSAVAAFAEGTGELGRDEKSTSQHGGSNVVPLVPNTPTIEVGAVIERVFITHGRNHKVLDQIKEIVAYGNFSPVVAQERESTAKPVPAKVMEDMRSCQAAVIHVSAEGTYNDSNGVEHPRINENVLIEIGAAMALYRGNFILVVEDGLAMPSNLQGLYECRYAGDELNTTATMKLLKAFKDFRDKAAA